MNLQDELGITFVVVTHDQEEAMTLSTRIAVMNQGRFEQVGPPGEVYEYPRNRFIADFVGNINLFETTVEDWKLGRARLACEATGAELAADCKDAPETGSRSWLAVRPEKIYISKEAPNGNDRSVVKGVVEDLGYFGNLSVFRVRLASGKLVQVSAQNRVRSATRLVEWEDEVYLSWDVTSAILLED